MKLYSFLLSASLSLALAKDLSIGLLNSDWEIEKKCSAELDTVQEALLAHVAETMPDRSARLSIPYDCPKYCEDMPDELCKQITRGYCSGNEHSVQAEETPDELMDDLTEDLAEDLLLEDFGHRKLQYHCPTICRGFTPKICALITNNYCTGNWNSGRPNPQDYLVTWLKRKLIGTSSTVNKDEAVSEGSDVVVHGTSEQRQLPYHCPTICRGFTPKICAFITYNYCTGNWNSGRTWLMRKLIGTSSTVNKDEAVADDNGGYHHRELINPSALDIKPSEFGHRQLFYHCPTYCRRVSSELCARLTYGYCTEGADEVDKPNADVEMKTGHNLRGTSKLTDPSCDMAVIAMEAKFEELVGDLGNQDCALAIIKANVMFKCSATKEE